MNFYQRSEGTLGTLYYQDDYYYTHAQFFFLNSIHGFGLVVKDKLLEGDMRRSREEVFTWAASFMSSICACVKIDTKTAGKEAREEEVLKGMMIEYPPQTSLPLIALRWICLFGWQTYWILFTNQTENGLLSNNAFAIGQMSYQFAYTYRLVHFFKSRILPRVANSQTLSFLRSLTRSHFCFEFHATRRQKIKIKSWVGDYFHPTTACVPFKYGYSFTRLKRTHYIGMELQKNNWTSVKYEAHNSDN